MRFLKFNTELEANVVCDRVFTAANADGKFAQGTTAYAIPEKEEYYTVPVLDGFEIYFTNTELSGAEMFAEEKQGSLVITDLKLALKGQNLTTTQMTSLINTLLSTIVGILFGDLRAARMLANNTATTAVYTAARKTWLLARLDEEIAKL